MNYSRNLFVIIIVTLTAGKQLFAQSNYRSLLVTKPTVFYNETVNLHFVDNKSLFEERWDTLPQPKFWQDVICLSPDSCIINVAGTRQSLAVVTNDEWKCQGDTEKESYRECLRKSFSLENEASIYVTSGKKEFYEYKKVIPLISIASDVFIQNNVDPWYAQTILLIESPGKYGQKSSVGANGPFQLMKNVAKKYGLHVNKNVDERTDLRKSAGAASKLLGISFIPKVKEMLDSKNISYNETDLWFRLLVMHAYHAGPGNVKCVLDEINPSSGGIPLFRQIWQTECRGFKNESQNYSQIALASIILFDKLINKEKDTVFMIEGDRLLARYKKVGLSVPEANNYLNSCIHAYQNDLVEGTIPFDYFFKKIGSVQKEFAYLEYKNSNQEVKKMTSRVPMSVEQFISLGDQLLKKKKVDEAIRVFKLNVEQHPNSPLALDSLGRAYQISGNKILAVKYANKSAALKGSSRNAD
ncbi:MAG: transglycosylase SLT domain-containing protein [Bacteroidia bacterium]